jgi:hypothetical protein
MMFSQSGRGYETHLIFIVPIQQKRLYSLMIG